ncbi:MAG: pyridoxamine 5'-phosphate oxidase family protein [Fimbriimonadaceae bacterium]|nr:pyridoxamine 5'-phosphate oxidase family protein [Alphaproteobacteria bacterium]
MSKWSEVAYTDAVRNVQERYGTREFNRRIEEREKPTEITDDLAAFIATRDSIYLATASTEGRPYIQHRGGAVGFIKVLDNHHIGFAEYPGNKQLISTGNLSENDHAFIFMMDYPMRQRIKLWGRAEISDDPELVSRLLDGEQKSSKGIARALRFKVEAWDANCPKYIQQRYTQQDIALATEVLRRRIEELEAEVLRLKG